jgi:uroporphyrinogen III methyltransferase/synthase
MPAKPLLGKRVVVTRNAEQAGPLVEGLQSLGATVIAFPVIRLLPLHSDELEQAVAHLERYDWLVFTSGNAVRFFWTQLEKSGMHPGRVRVAAAGSATAGRLRALGIEPDFTPAEFTGERLAEGLGDVAGKRVLLPRARIGRPEIVALLRRRGAIVDDIPLYDTDAAGPDEEAWAARAGPIDCVTFTSPSSVRNWLALLRGRELAGRPAGPGVAVACIGPVTAAEAEKHGLPVDIMPAEYTIDGLIAAVADYFSERVSHAGTSLAH